MKRHGWITRTISAIAVMLVSMSTAISAQAGGASVMSTCADWQDRSGPDYPEQPMYRMGLVHGLATGMAASPFIYAEGAGDLLPPQLTETFFRGWRTLLPRPAVLLEAFDQKCSDYRNRAVRLVDITLLAILEMGGTPAPRIGRALELLRSEGGSPIPHTRPLLLEVLTSGQ